MRDWQWWQLPPVIRAFVGAVILAALVVIAVTAARTDWREPDLLEFLALVTCGAISVASTPRSAYGSAGGVTNDFSTVWVLSISILLPPVYAAVAPIVLIAIMYFCVHQGVPHRRVFTAATISLSYVVAGEVFRLFPASFAGTSLGSSTHAFTWAVAVAACELSGCRMQHFLVVGAVKLSNPAEPIMARELNRDALQGLFVEIDLAVLVTVAVAVSPYLMLITLPSVLLVRRFLIHPFLVAQSRVDSKTGLLNVSTWEAEAEAELSRAVRTSSPAALALVDIDHFKLVNDTYGHLVGDRVLKAIGESLTRQSRSYDRAGRFGGEEFVLLLAQTGEQDACKIAERLRGYIGALDVPVDDRPGARTLRVTISIGVTAFAAGEIYELTDLLAAADSAMYAAKQAGRDQVACARPLHDMGLGALGAAAAPSSGTALAGDSSLDEQLSLRDRGTLREGAPRAQDAGLAGGTSLSSHRVELVQGDQPGPSSGPRPLLSVP